MKPLADLKADELKFLHAYTRRALIGWCAQGLANGDGSFAPTLPDMPGMASGASFAEDLVEYARSKKWVSRRGYVVLGIGYKTATGMMKVL